MKTYIAKWPNGSVSVLKAVDKTHLFSRLDEEGDPFCCELFEIKSKADYFYLSLNISKQGNESFIKVEDIANEDNLKKIKLPKDSLIKHLSVVTGKSLKELKALGNLQEIKKGMGIS